MGRQHSRALRQSTLVLLTFLIKQQSNRFTAEQLAPVLDEVASMVSDEDLQLCNLALGFCTAVVQCHSAAASLVRACGCVCGCREVGVRLSDSCMRLPAGARFGLAHWTPSLLWRQVRCCKATRNSRCSRSCVLCRS